MKPRHRLVRVNVWLCSVALAVELLAALLQPWELAAVALQAVLTLGAWLNWADWKQDQRAARPRPDYARIAVLEHELLGIAPEPGTFLAASVALTKAFAPGGYISSPATIYDLPPFPAAMTQSRGKPCPHDEGQWMWSERVGRWWRCPACPKPVPPPGPGAGSPTVR